MRREVRTTKANSGKNKGFEISNSQEKKLEQKDSQLPRFTNTFQKNDPNPNHRFNKHFSKKYDESLPLIKHIQMEKDNMNSPFVNAQKSLKYILKSELQMTSTMSTDLPTSFNFTRTIKPQNKPSTAPSYNSYLDDDDLNQPFLINLSSLGDLEERLQWILDFASRDSEVPYPSFQGYWEVLFEARLEKLYTLFRNEEWKANIDFSLLLNVSGVAFFQCLSLKLHESPFLLQTALFNKLQSEIRNVLEIIFQSILILISLVLQKVPANARAGNPWFSSLERTIYLKRVQQSKTKSDELLEIKKNNQLAEASLKGIIKLLQKQLLLGNPELEKIKPIYSVISHALRERHNFQLTKLRENIINGTFLSIRQEQSQEDSIMKTIYHPVDAHSGFNPLDLIGLPPGEEPVTEFPFLQPRTPEEIKAKPYTLVLDLDETLGHYDSQKSVFLERPHLHDFLESLSEYYELVIFTAGLQDYADSIIPNFDKNNLIQHRLYRQHCNLQGMVHIKDLNHVGRDLSKTIILDNNQHNFKYQIENAIFVTTWYNDMQDHELNDLKKVLIKLAKSKTSDVRWALQKYRDHVIRQISSGVENPYEI